MSTATRLVHAPPAKVWDVLADGWLFPLWVVGAARVRGVDEGWPAAGSAIHHSVGAWPLLIDDRTVVRDAEPPASLRLRARGWPAGEAEVLIRLQAHGAGTRVRIDEDAVAGPGRFVPAPVRGPLLVWRNTETLRRLALLAERR